MNRYIEQLVDDLRKATENIRPPHKLWEETGADPFDEVELEDMSYIEQFVEGEEVPIASITGVKAEAFPPADKLTTDQQALLAMEMESLLSFFHFAMEFPENYPRHLRYGFLCNFWHESHVPLSFGTSHIEFCDFDEETCPFPGYCECCEEMRIEEEKKINCEPLDIDPADLLPTDADLERWWKYQQELNARQDMEGKRDDEDDDEDTDDLSENKDDLPF